MRSISGLMSTTVTRAPPAAKDPASRYLDASSLATDFRRALVASPKPVEGDVIITDGSQPVGRP